MVSVIMYIDSRWNYTQSDRDIEVMQMFKETCKALGAESLIIVNRTGFPLIYDSGDIEFTVTEVATLNEAVALFSAEIPKFYFEQESLIPAGVNKTTLDDLIHPDDAVYIFGGDVGGLNPLEISLGINDCYVSITLTPYALWLIAAISIALYDRYMKRK